MNNGFTVYPCTLLSQIIIIGLPWLKKNHQIFWIRYSFLQKDIFCKTLLGWLHDFFLRLVFTVEAWALEKGILALVNA
jgi:hypothetical protein